MVAMQAAEAAAGLGIDVEVLDLRTLVPLDVGTIAESVCAPVAPSWCRKRRSPAGSPQRWWPRCRRVRSSVWEASIARVSGWDVPYPMPLVEDHYVPSVDRVVAAIRRTVEF